MLSYLKRYIYRKFACYKIRVVDLNNIERIVTRTKYLIDRWVKTKSLHHTWPDDLITFSFFTLTFYESNSRYIFRKSQQNNYFVLLSRSKNWRLSPFPLARHCCYKYYIYIVILLELFLDFLKLHNKNIN